MNDYWSKRFQNGGMIWGTEPSPTAGDAAALFERYGLKRILVPGAGYGRNTKALSGRFRTEAIELSEEAFMLGRQWDPETLFRHGSVLDPGAAEGIYDGIYAYDVLHLFLQAEREQLAANCRNWLASGGVIYITCFSDEDSHCGTGREIEAGTYEYSPGKYSHFFSEEGLLSYFPGFEIVSLSSVEETLRYGQGGGEKKYRLRCLAARKP